MCCTCCCIGSPAGGWPINARTGVPYSFDPAGAMTSRINHHVHHVQPKVSRYVIKEGDVQPAAPLTEYDNLAVPQCRKCMSIDG